MEEVPAWGVSTETSVCVTVKMSGSQVTLAKVLVILLGSLSSEDTCLC